MALNPLLTEANWKKKGAPLRTLKEKLKQKNTGVTAALKAVEKADKKLMTNIFLEKSSKEMGAALKELVTCLKKMEASDKKLQALAAQMIKEAKSYAQEYNALLRKINADTIGGVPGGLEALRKSSKAEFSEENMSFKAKALKVGKIDGLLGLYREFIRDDIVNIPNKAVWDKLVTAYQSPATTAELKPKIEAEIKKALGVSVRAVVGNQNDTVSRLTLSCLIPVPS